MATLPETADQPRAAPASADGPVHSAAPILLLDDESASLSALHSILAELDANLIEARTPDEALGRLESESFAVVLLDLSRPPPGGLDTARRIRAAPKGGGTPLIFLSNEGIDLATLESGYALGEVDFLFKPILPIVLREKVRGLLERFRRKRRSEQEAELLRGMVRSLTEAEDRLRRSEQRFAGFMQHLPGLAWIKDREGRYVYVNDAAETAFRTPRERLYGLTDDQVFPPETAAQFREHDRLAIESGRGVQVIEQLADARGEIRHSLVSKFPIVEGDGRIELVGGMAVDITDLRRVQAALAESEERFRGLMEQAPFSIQILSADGRTLTVNRAWEDLWGITLADLADYNMLRDPQLKAKGIDSFIAAAFAGRPVAIPAIEYDVNATIPHRSQHADPRRWVAAVAYPLIDAGGTVRQVVLVHRDITTERRALDQLRDADRRKDEFLATLAHELRNPLAPIRNSLEILKLPRIDPQIAEETRGVMERQVQHLVRLVDDLLDVSRVMRGKIELRLEPVEPAGIIARAVETVKPLIELQAHRLELAVSDDSLLLLGDPVRLTQVVGNLLTNAAKYTEAGGLIRITAHRDGGQAVICIEDSGIGIEPAVLPHVFELFVQGENAFTRAQGGLGIGLTLVKNLVELHGGTVEVASPGPHLGSRFTVRLPLVPAAVGSSDRPSLAVASAEPPRTGFRVLVVDDNTDAALTLSMLLRLKGHEVRVAHDGRAALEAAADFRPDLIFLDLGMPEMDGFETARRLRAIPGLEKTILAALTGWGQEEDRRKTAAAGFDRHLVKPPEPKAIDDLLSALKALRG